jgi:hypothetical protein
MPSPAALYRQVLIAARDHAYALNRQGVERLYRAFAMILNRLAAEEGTEVLTPLRAERLRQEVDAMLRALQLELTRTTESSVGHTLVDLTELHRRATNELFRLAGLRAVAVNFDSVPARALAAMVSRPGAATFQTLYRRRIRALAPEIDAFLDAAVARGVSAGRGARDLARILARDDSNLIRLLDRVDIFTEELHVGAGVIDYGRYGLSEVDTKALRTLLYDARRIQVSETNNALRAANDAAVSESPVVLATQWQRSGRHHVPDVCDMLAETDAHGFGAGFYPAGRFPVAPHSHCACYAGRALFRRPSEWTDPKPAPRPLSINPSDPIHTERWADDWTPTERERYQNLFTAILREGSQTRRAA